MVGAGSAIRHNQILPPGSTAPDFSLLVTPNQTLSLRELLGRPVILTFYPADWSPVCGDQMALYNEILPEFTNYNATLLGISVDGVWCHAAFAAARHLHFPLAADFEPKGHVARLYGVYRDRIDNDFRGGVRSGVNGTPTFFINGLRYDGSYDFDGLLEATVQR